MVGDSVGDWQELSTLYERADALDNGERAALIDELRSSAHRLLPDLERMLGARVHIDAADFMSVLPRIETAEHAPTSDWGEGSRVGPYRLIRHVGSGGMAEVWLAERCDGAFERRVAIKLLFNHPTRSQRESFVERFRRERDILASLSHPNVATLHDAGVTSGGQPWLALEYIDGTPITAWCEARALSIVDRVGLLVQVLSAVQHAHANLVLHRDLKPSNILVTPNGEAKLLDFGVSKLMAAAEVATPETALTRAAGRPLTLMYASPEQVSGASLSTACDVYSLGVVGYELLAGVHPYRLDKGTFAEVERAVLEVIPRAPSRQVTPEARRTSSRRVDGPGGLAPDLDAIILKAIDKDPGRRYTSAEAFRDDLERWLSAKPVLAVPPSILYRAHKFAQRHRRGVVLAGIATAASAAAVASLVVMGIHARTEASRALAAKDFVFELFRMADPDSAGADQVTARDVLKAGLQKAATQFANQPELQADVLGKIAQTQSHLGDYRAANETLKRALAIQTRVGRPERRLEAQVALADNLFRLGDFAGAKALLQQIDAVAKGDRPSSALRADIALVNGWVLLAEGEYERSRIEMGHSLREARAGGPASESRIIDALRGLAEAESYLSSFDAALLHIGEASERMAAASEPAQSDLISIRWERAKIEVGAGRYAAARRTVAAASERCDATLGTRNENCLLLLDLQTTILLRLGDPAAAVATLPSLIEQANDDRSPRRQVEALMAASRVVAANGLTTAHPHLLGRLEAIAGPGATPPLSDEVRARILLTLAEIDILTLQPSRAVQRLRQSIGITPAFAKDNLLEARSALLLGVALQATGEFGASLAPLEDALRRYVSSLGPEHSLVALYRLNYAISLAAMGRLGEARTLVDKSLPILGPSMGEGSPVVERATQLRARLLSVPDGAGEHRRLAGFFT